MKKRARFLAITLIIVTLISSCASGVQVNHGEEYTPYAYLNEYFSIGWKDKNDPFFLNDFKNSLRAINPEYDNEGSNIVEAALYASGYKELLGVYDAKKIKARKTWYYTDSIKGIKDASLFAFLDSGLGNIEIFKDGKISADEANLILLNVANALGKARHYIGFSNDEDINVKMRDAFNSFVIFEDEKLNEIGAELVKNQIVTGYNLKSDVYNASFLSDYTLTYGHDNIDHAIQLIALLNSEGIIARIQLEPKVSIYQYLLEWGPIPEPSARYRVEKESDDLYLVHAVEYDMQLEFSKKRDKERFDAVINKNAKKNSSNPELIGLIKGSWWQPLYTSKTPIKGDYENIINNRLLHNGYSINSFTVATEMLDFSPITDYDESMTSESVPLYANKAFYNYLIGNDYE